MSLLSLMEGKLPPGFRFHPKDEELVCHYLAKKVAVAPGSVHSLNFDDTPMMTEVDLNKIEPWDLPDAARVGERQWYFYSLRDRKYATGLRTNRATMSGYWKATGKDRQIVDHRRGIVVGMRKTLVFYQGRAPRGKNTEWVMHEFRLEGPFEPAPKPTFKEDWVLCRVFHKNKCDLPGKQCQYENSYDDTGSSSSDLPPLSDSLLSFDQTPLSLEVFDEQVPCFSNFTQTNSSPTLQAIPQVESTNIPIWEMVHTKALPDLADFLNPISYEKNVIKSVLDQLTKMDGNQIKSMELAPRYGLVAGSCESYFPEMGMATILPQL